MVKNKEPKVNKNGKITVTKKMSMREFLNILWMFENMAAFNRGERPDLSADLESELAKVEKRTFRFTEEEKKIFDDYFDKYVGRKSFDEWHTKVGKKPAIAIAQGQMVSSQTIQQIIPAKAPAKDSPAAPAQPVGNMYQAGKYTYSDADIDPVEGYVKVAPGYTMPASDYEHDYPITTPCIGAKVPSFSDRISMWKQGRVADTETKMVRSYADFPFIIDPNKELTDDNVDRVMLIRAIEAGLTSQPELKWVLGNYLMHLATFAPDMDELEQLPSYYKAEVNWLNCVMTAQTMASSTVNELSLNEPDDDYDTMLSRFTNYLTNTTTPCEPYVSEYQKLEEEFIDHIYNVEGNTVYFDTNDEDERLTSEIKYDGEEEMVQDLIALGSKFGLDYDQPINVFGKKTTLLDIIKDIHDRFPNGFDGKFYNTRMEAYFAGELKRK